jgi:hypothetical protein
MLPRIKRKGVFIGIDTIFPLDPLPTFDREDSRARIPDSIRGQLCTTKNLKGAFLL